jgi:pimeloyl-ACP methyl ester carboxylesterase
MQPLPLPAGIRSRFVEGINGLRVHLLEAGEEGRPLLLPLHGFPELAYSWRKVMVPLAEAGFHVVAPDQRGYGRTTGADTRYEGDLVQYRLVNLARDALALVRAMGREDCLLVGHDFGSIVASYAALVRPDVFRRVCLMSAPFAGVPKAPARNVNDDLAAMGRKHYHWYYSTPEAARDMDAPPEGLEAFIRAYYHMKGGAWPENRPEPLREWSAAELARLPHYYVMPLAASMPEACAPARGIADPWLSDHELAVYAGEYARTGFQGGLNWYRIRTSGRFEADLGLFAGRRIECPACFIAGANDWGIRQAPGALERMATEACADWRGTHLVAGAGHWVQQEAPEAVLAHLLPFLRG